MNHKAELTDLIDVWWKTADIMEASSASASQERKSWHAHIFEKILIQCGWTIEEWNEAMDLMKEEE
jgi:hypothetical protein